jgi:hypothetical protein
MAAAKRATKSNPASTPTQTKPKTSTSSKTAKDQPAKVQPAKDQPALDDLMVEVLSLARFKPGDKTLCRIPEVGAVIHARIVKLFRFWGVHWDHSWGAHRFPSDASVLISKAISQSGIAVPQSSRFKPRTFEPAKRAKAN